MKKTFLFIASLFQTIAAFACPVCDKQQPKILRGIAHGAGPESGLDYIIVWTVVIVALITLFYSIKYLIGPREAETTHIKRTILTFD